MQFSGLFPYKIIKMNPMPSQAFSDGMQELLRQRKAHPFPDAPSLL